MADTDTKPGEVNEKTGFRVATAAEVKKVHDSLPRTKANSHRANQRGYAVPDNANGAGVLVEDGEIVPANVPVGEWMDKIKGSTALADAVAETQQPLKDDPDLTQLSKPALEALATEAGVTSVKGLSKDDLIAAINAERDNTR
jgi:hypothetical protein